MKGMTTVTRWIALGAVILLAGCNGGPRRVDAIDAPLALPVDVTLIEPEEMYPPNLEGAYLIENRGRLYLAGGFLQEFTPSGVESERYYGVWMSDDGIHWTVATDEFRSGVRDSGFAYAFYSFDGYLWATEIIFRHRHPDAPENIRLFRSTNGVEWQVVNEDYDPFTSGSWKISAPERVAYQFAGQRDDSRFLSNRVNVSRDGIDWESSEYEDPEGFFSDSISTHAVANDVPYLLDFHLRQVGRFDSEELIWESLLIDPETHAKLFLTEVSDRNRRFESAFVGHNDHLYIIAGHGWSAENTWNQLQERPSWLNDVWRSPDGIEWERVGRQLPFTEEEEQERGYRYNFDTFPARRSPQVVSWRGVLYLTGGEGYARWNGEWIYHQGQDAWVSRDGETWYELARVRGSRRQAEPLVIESSMGEIVGPPDQ